VFWNQGHCNRGSTCAHIHSDGELGRIIPPHSTAKVCWNWQRGSCTFGSKCRFSHDDYVLAPGTCWSLQRHGRCDFGLNCRFSHGSALVHDETFVLPMSVPQPALPGAGGEPGVDIAPPQGGGASWPGYRCKRCKQPGHYIKYCPTNDDPTYDQPRQLPRGITPSNLRPADENDLDDMRRVYRTTSGALTCEITDDEARAPGPSSGLGKRRQLDPPRSQVVLEGVRSARLQSSGPPTKKRRWPGYRPKKS
jgi:hypothetical protein